MRHNAVVEFQKKFAAFQTKVMEAIRLLDTVKDMPTVVERQLPTLIHFQVCEGLRKTIGEIMPQKVIAYEKYKLKEFIDFNAKFGNIAPNLEKLGQRIRLISKYALNTDKGMVPFVFGKDFTPNMPHDQASVLSGIDRMAFQYYNKTQNGDPTIFEAMYRQLQKIKQKKLWTNLDVGESFADLLVKEPEPPVVIMQQPQYDYYDEYGPEDYGHEEIPVSHVAGGRFRNVTTNKTGGGNPLQNAKLKMGTQAAGSRVAGKNYKSPDKGGEAERRRSSINSRGSNGTRGGGAVGNYTVSP